MLIGFNAFGEVDNLIFDNRLCHMSYNKLEISKGMIDQIYVDEDISIPYSTEKPLEWRYLTVLNARLKNSLEGGSVEANDNQIERIRFQKRKWDELEWQDVAEIDYKSSDKILYEAIDKYIANDFIYQYSILPITSTIMGNRVVSDEIKAEFEGVFISDKDSNYQMLYNVDLSDIENITSSAIFETKGSKYPIVVYSNLDYDSFEVSATFLSAETYKSNEKTIDIRMERLGKDRLLRFMKNGRPKIYRDHNGNLKLVSVVGSPKESPHNTIGGISRLSFALVEIGDMNSDTLRNNNLLEGLTEVF